MATLIIFAKIQGDVSDQFRGRIYAAVLCLSGILVPVSNAIAGYLLDRLHGNYSQLYFIAACGFSLTLLGLVSASVGGSISRDRGDNAEIYGEEVQAPNANPTSPNYSSRI